MSLRRRNEILEWQLWMHPYPTLVKTKRVNPSLLPSGRIFKDGSEFVRLSDLFEAKKRTTPPQLKRCVLAIVKKEVGSIDNATREAVSKAFAICTRNLQKYGYLEKGSQSPTGTGQKRGRSKAADSSHKDKLAEFEKMLTVVREKGAKKPRKTKRPKKGRKQIAASRALNSMLSIFEEE